MIREHEFNSAWWQEGGGRGKAGIVESAEFFAGRTATIRDALEPFEWVEFRSAFGPELPLARIHDAGFFCADIQVNFRIGLPREAECVGECAEPISLEPASDGAWRVDTRQWALFKCERFRLLPGVTPESLNRRYARWAADLIRNAPDHCFEVRSAGEVGGWYFGKPGTGGSVNLALGVLRREACVSGCVAYQAALRRFGAMGYRTGWASFSAANTAVHNIYAQLGARFLRNTGIWLWIRNV